MKTILSLVAGVAVFVLLLVNHQNIYDWFHNRTYQPPPAISDLVKQDALTPYATKILYANRPAILEKQFFSAYCRTSELTITLSCYQPGQASIYILDTGVPGAQQQGIAHEMLHVGYSRLSSQERTQVNGWLEDYFNHGLTDQRLKDTLSIYQQTEPGQAVNEMHSIFGTEIGSLPAPLETYYKRYFTDRSRVVNYSNQITEAEKQ